MLKKINGNQKNFINKLELILEKRKLNQNSKIDIVKKIISDVKKNGDKALIKYEKKFSNIKTKKNTLKFTSKEINAIEKSIDKKIKKSIDIAFNRIKNFHTKRPSSLRYNSSYSTHSNYTQCFVTYRLT